MLSEISSASTVYDVGDSSGWTIVGNVDYNQWASSKLTTLSFSISILNITTYYKWAARTSTPATSLHRSPPTPPGTTSIPIRNSGQYFYICGFVGHCQAGQKVDIRVLHSIQPTGTPTESPDEGPKALGYRGPASMGLKMSGSFMNSGKSMLRDFVLLIISFLLCFLF